MFQGTSMKNIPQTVYLLLLGALLCLTFPIFDKKTPSIRLALDGVDLGETRRIVFSRLGIPYRIYKNSEGWKIVAIDTPNTNRNVVDLSAYNVWSYQRIKSSISNIQNTPDLYTLRVEFDSQLDRVSTITCSLIWNHQFFTTNRVDADLCKFDMVKLGDSLLHVNGAWGKGDVLDSSSNTRVVYYPKKNVTLAFQGDTVFSITLSSEIKSFDNKISNI